MLLIAESPKQVVILLKKERKEDGKHGAERSVCVSFGIAKD